jgi:membrane-associated phospholipid phosphatase
MRSSEWISVGVYALFVAGSLATSLEPRRRRRVVGLGSAGGLLATGLAVLGGRPGVEPLRDFVPGLFLLLGYWQAGQFFTGGRPSVERALHLLDVRWFPGLGSRGVAAEQRARFPTYPQAWLGGYLEATYFLCYLLVPLAIAVLYFLGRPDQVDALWTVVLPPTFACYVLTVLFPGRPPRLLEGEGGTVAAEKLPGSGFRSLNLWILRHAGMGGNTFPSGHVTSAVAIALVILALDLVAGLVFLWVAASITVATVVLRYHYAADALMGIALAVLAFAVLGR